ncbi:hypothetical protein [Streptomyces sp. MH60]|uniref:hypothetical protein n=1 Tax=Streptomyces sp. MH60 TaxID=1940758 RepID=UPI000CEE5656|nr:hypothetical protein [Streptomyces sp. MH60]PPS89552.1 hypothetical protein BZZ08_01699 [Streptomyces sp. MH60]
MHSTVTSELLCLRYSDGVLCREPACYYPAGTQPSCEGHLAEDERQDLHDQQRAEQIQQAAATLHKLADMTTIDSALPSPAFPAPASLRQMAEAVASMLTEEGEDFARRLNQKRVIQKKPNLPLRLPETLRDDIKAAAVISGASLDGEAHQALQEFLAGRFTPKQPVRAARGDGAKSVNLNIRVDPALRKQAEDLGHELLAHGKLTWAPKVTQIIRAWLVERLDDEFRNPQRYNFRPPAINDRSSST